MEIFIAIWGLAMIICAGIALVLAPRRGRNGQTWAFWCFVFPPALAILYRLKRRVAPIRSRPPIHEDDLRDLLH